MPDELKLPESLQALIAARLDTLTAERKALLQDAAVVGKVFWPARSPRWAAATCDELEQALHELSRKELVRPCACPSMRGGARYGFWHILVRDVAYAQIPRAVRAQATARRPMDRAGARAHASRT